MSDESQLNLSGMDDEQFWAGVVDDTGAVEPVGAPQPNALPAQSPHPAAANGTGHVVVYKARPGSDDIDLYIGGGSVVGLAIAATVYPSSEDAARAADANPSPPTGNHFPARVVPLSKLGVLPEQEREWIPEARVESAAEVERQFAIPPGSLRRDPPRCIWCNRPQIIPGAGDVVLLKPWNGMENVTGIVGAGDAVTAGEEGKVLVTIGGTQYAVDMLQIDRIVGRV